MPGGWCSPPVHSTRSDCCSWRATGTARSPRSHPRSGSGPNGGGYYVRRDLQGRHRYVVVEVAPALGGSRLPRFMRDWLGASTIVNTIGRDSADAQLELHGDGLGIRSGGDLDRRFFDEMHAELRRLAEHYGPRRIFARDN